jgi:uncharacterized Ntn-hydrolase superfamily protein
MSINTFSIIARDPLNGDLGLAVASKFLAAGAVVPWIAAGVGVMAVQALPGAQCGPRGLEMMRDGMSGPQMLDHLMAADPGRDQRQVAVVDALGATGAHTGASCMAWAGHQVGDGYSCQGNILVGAETIAAMAEAFEGSEGELSNRLLAALCAADLAGGDKRGRQSAALVVARRDAGYMGSSDMLVDLRVDDAHDPCRELRRLHGLHRFYFGTSPSTEMLKIEGDLACEIQDLLIRAGYYAGEPNGDIDEATKIALEAFVTIENLEERVDLDRLMIDPPALRFMRDRDAAEVG